MQISSTCPVCVTYEARSKFIITSLRPAFAKIYPSTRPDLAVETFFHARPGSPLLRGITDDDFITWFDKTELASLKTTANIDNICECGRICSRDYEFRKHVESTSNKETPKVTTETSEVSKATKPSNPTISTTTVKETTTENVPSTSRSFPKETPTVSFTTEIITTETLVTNNTLSGEDRHEDDPIIIPTVTYLNQSSQNIDNNIAPLLSKPNGELIVQKLPPPKQISKKEDLKKKSLPRRKGTLKATYGDKQEKFFVKPSKVVITVPPVVNETNKPNLHEIPFTKSNFTEIRNIVVENETKIIKVNNNTDKNLNVTKEENLKIVHENANKVTKAHHNAGHSETSTSPHTITAITNSNIKTIHYRTKKPKAMTQIKKLKIETKHNNITKQSKNDSIEADSKINKTKMKSITQEKYVTKTLKSINKEIHKVPPTPISETSKTLSDPPKSDIAPENRGGFEILDKNNIWELLKEGSDTDKIEDKIQVHNRLNVLAQNVSIVAHDNRSL